MSRYITVFLLIFLVRGGVPRNLFLKGGNEGVPATLELWLESQLEPISRLDLEVDKLS